MQMHEVTAKGHRAVDRRGKSAPHDLPSSDPIGFADRGRGFDRQNGAAWNFGTVPLRAATNRPSAAVPLLGRLQTKLVVGTAGDRFEQEADSIADQAVSTSQGGPVVGISPLRISRKCDACMEEESELRRKPDGFGQADESADELVPGALASPGKALDQSTRHMMESRIGFDFSRVRIHSDPTAAAAADRLSAQAFTVGTHIAFAQGRHRPDTAEGRHLLAHELTHVVQQSGGSREVATTTPRIQRLVNTASVNCPAASAGIANPHTGSSDRRASTLLDMALNRIDRAQAARVASPADADVVTVGNALRTVFHLDPADANTWTAAAPDVRLPVIQRRLQIAKNYIDSVLFTVNCIPNGGAGFTIPGCTNSACQPGTEAFSCHANSTALVLCPDFWALGVDQRGRTWMHEVMHITFQFIDDWAQPNVHNAHCYAQFVALLNGFNSPAGFRCP
jgi:hypothetical protein